MQFIRNSIFTRSDTLIGICQALGEDFGVNPTWFRVGFAAIVVLNIEVALFAYFGAGALVLLSRMVVPGRGAAEEAEVAPAPTAQAEQPASGREPVMAEAA